MSSRNNFDGVRLLGALAVLVSHQFWLTGRAQPLTIGPITLGGMAVLVFFSISGYLVASSWAADPSLWRFALRRFLRIWPAYAFVVVCTALWLAVSDKREIAPFAAWVYAYKNLVFVHFDWTFFPLHRDARLNGSLWTIPAEVACYVVFATLAAALGRFWPTFIAGVGLAAFAWWGFGMAAFDPSQVALAAYAPLFCAFSLFGASLFGLPALRQPKASLALVAGGLLAFALGSEVIGLLLTVPVLTILVGSASWPVLRDAGRYGDFSYGIYLWGWPVQQGVVSWLGPEAGFWPAMAASLAITTLLAALSWQLVEKRALRAKPTPQTRWPDRLRLQLD